ncbi:GNAT family N-acetyltransferase [uncultured Amphritea sp.]|uniref:GNAT family N-acetyltransferase n=1 Tax=uncultured Amphritea sp. TaxID=981605 RepID=UPI00262FB2F0|nr:GNAT family N-acetyltransferase [uncultured Amphritea sp.]
MVKLWMKNCSHRVERLPVISLSVSDNYYKAFTSPNPDHNARIYNAAEVLVGKTTFAVSPLYDRVYLFDIEVIPEYRRQGYATAVLRYLTGTYNHPITAIKELYGASDFWASARRLKEVGIIVTEPLSCSEMDHEAARWQHLQPEVDRLDKLINERLTVYNEPWHSATGRGLETMGLKDDR